METVEFVAETYDFKKAMKMNIKEKINPILYENHFKQYSNYKYVREIDKIAQFITFRVGVDSLKTYAMYFPIFIPFDNILDYGIEITGSSGIQLLNGKYFTTIYEYEKFDKSIQLQNYKKYHLNNFDKLVLNIQEGIIPEMDSIKCLKDFTNKFQNEQTLFFGHSFRKVIENHTFHKFIFAVYECLYGNFKQGQMKLQELKKYIEEQEDKEYTREQQLREYVEKLLPSEENDGTKESLLFYLNELCDKRRKKYKLI